MSRPKKSSITQRLILGFSVLILIFILFGVYALFDIHRISRLSSTIYNHPLVVSNAAYQANLSIAKMHRSMKDVVLFHSSSKIQQSVEAVNEEEEQVYRQLNIVKNIILGEEGKALENEARKLFDEWRPIRKEVIELVHNDQREVAANITIGKGADHVALLEKKMLGLTDYARKKASLFNDETEILRSRLNIALIFFLVLGVSMSLLVAFFTLKMTSSSAKDLQKSEEQYRSLIENQTDLICRFMPDGTFVFVNDMYCKFFNKSKKALIGSKWHPIPVDEDIEVIEERLSTLSTTNPIVTIENRVLSGKGEIHWMQFINHGFFDRQGNLKEIQSVGRDISERKEAEFLIQKSTETLKQAQSVGKIGSWWYDTATKMPTWTEEMFRIFGLEPQSEAIPYEDHRKIIHPEDWYRFDAAVTRAVTEGRGYDLELRISHPSGEIRYINSKCIAKKNDDGVVIQLIGTTQDISERMQSELALRESEKKYRSLFENSIDGIVLHDLGGTISDTNTTIQGMLNYGPEELKGMPLEMLHPDSEMETCRNALERTQKKGYNRFETQFKNKDGLLIDARVNSSIIDYEAGLVQGIVRNITKQKKLEAQLHQSQKMESIALLAGGVAHDYNNISSIIIGYAELALEQVTQDDPLHEDLVEILTAAKRSTEITRQLLAFARKQTISPKVLDLNDTIGSMLKMLRRLIGEDIDLAWLPGAEVWPVKIDPSQVDQILANLCVNARDAIADVGKVTIETKNICFNKEYCADHAGFVPGDFVLLAISDDGSGIAPGILDTIFEPFFTTKGLGKGTGLGLSTVYGIVKQNNGFINVYSERKKGTTIRIYLPLHTGMGVESHSENPTETPLSQGETVLLVEDDRSILKLGKRILEELGYSVLSASSPREAIELTEAQTGEINLLITDVIMPEMNGRELSEHLHSLYPELKVLFMSGYTANVIAHRGVLDDSVNFISKPFSKKEMAVKVREALDFAKGSAQG